MADRSRDGSVLVGFPGIAGALVEDTVVLTTHRAGTTWIGEVDGAATQRLQQTASILTRAGLDARVNPHVVTWVREHSAALALSAASLMSDRPPGREGWERSPSPATRDAMTESLAILDATFGGGENRVAASSPGRTDSMSTRAASLLRQPRWTDSALLYRAVTGGDEVAAYLAQLLEWARRERVDSPHLRAIADDLASR